MQASLWEVVGLKGGLLRSQGPQGIEHYSRETPELLQTWGVAFAAALMQPKSAPAKSNAGVWGDGDAKVILLHLPPAITPLDRRHRAGAGPKDMLS